MKQVFLTPILKEMVQASAGHGVSFPFHESRNIVISDIQNGLFVVKKRKLNYLINLLFDTNNKVGPRNRNRNSINY